MQAYRGDMSATLLLFCCSLLLSVPVLDVNITGVCSECHGRVGEWRHTEGARSDVHFKAAVVRMCRDAISRLGVSKCEQ